MLPVSSFISASVAGGSAKAVVERAVDLINSVVSTRSTTRTVWGYPGDGVIADGMSLLTVPIGIPAFTGGRFDGVSKWYATDANGAALSPTLSVEDSVTNRCACVKANPVDTTGVSKGGDAAASVTVVDDSAALASANLEQVCTTGKVYKVDNSAGVSIAYAIISGSTSGATQHASSAYIRGGTGEITLNGVGTTTVSGVFGASADYRRVYSVETPAISQPTLIIANPGQTVYFILPQLEAGDRASAVVIGDTDTAAEKTRAADLNSIITPSVLSEAQGAFELSYTPYALQNVKYMLSTFVDSSNELQLRLNTTSIQYTKEDDDATTVPHAYTHVAGQKMRTRTYWKGGVEIGTVAANYEDDITLVSFSTLATTSNQPLAGTFTLGHRAGASLAIGEYSGLIFYAYKEAAGW